MNHRRQLLEGEVELVLSNAEGSEPGRIVPRRLAQRLALQLPRFIGTTRQRASAGSALFAAATRPAPQFRHGRLHRISVGPALWVILVRDAMRMWLKSAMPNLALACQLDPLARRIARGEPDPSRQTTISQPPFLQGLSINGEIADYKGGDRAK
ncbi:MAG: hypothetical protein A2W26_03130 [Acidobacteria bacterium RBG_16_64_8]|nr:MAG: hypothetical protein A2W26_03130 [Acidobacteria bacterium RBG_16_64_8]